MSEKTGDEVVDSKPASTSKRTTEVSDGLFNTPRSLEMLDDIDQLVQDLSEANDEEDALELFRLFQAENGSDMCGSGLLLVVLAFIMGPDTDTVTTGLYSAMCHKEIPIKGEMLPAFFSEVFKAAMHNYLEVPGGEEGVSHESVLH